MPETIYCWRCRIDIPMLTEVEWATLSPHLTDTVERIKSYRQQHSCSLQEALEKGLGDALEVYEHLTGFKETNPNALGITGAASMALLPVVWEAVPHSTSEVLRDVQRRTNLGRRR